MSTTGSIRPLTPSETPVPPVNTPAPNMGQHTVAYGRGAIGCAVEVIKQIGKAFIYAALLLPQLALKAIEMINSALKSPADAIANAALNSGGSPRSDSPALTSEAEELETQDSAPSTPRSEERIPYGLLYGVPERQEEQVKSLWNMGDKKGAESLASKFLKEENERLERLERAESRSSSPISTRSNSRADQVFDQFTKEELLDMYSDAKEEFAPAIRKELERRGVPPSEIHGPTWG